MNATLIPSLSSLKYSPALQETWKVYETHAMGMDELAPISLGAKSNFGNMGATLVDALDTLWMLGLKDEFQR